MLCRSRIFIASCICVLVSGFAFAFEPSIDAIESAWIAEKYPAGSLKDPARADAALDEVSVARRKADDLAAYEIRRCSENFFVNRCVDTVRQARLRASKRFLAIEVEARKTIREAKAKEEVRKQRERDAKHEARERAKDPRHAKAKGYASTPDAKAAERAKRRAKETAERQKALAEKAKAEDAYAQKLQKRLKEQEERQRAREKALAKRAEKKALKAAMGK